MLQMNLNMPMKSGQ